MSNSVESASIHQPAVVTPAAHGVRWGWLLTIVVAIVYGSLIPFELDPSVLTPALGFGLPGLGMHATGLGDVLTNVALYIPLGLALLLCVPQRSGQVPTSRVLLAVAAGTSLSLLVEVVQTGMPARVASWLDVLLNGSGTAIGILAGKNLMRIRGLGLATLRDRLIKTPFSLASSALALGLLVYYLLPFDFITNTSGLRAAFLRARWDLSLVQPLGAGWHSGGPPCHLLAPARLVGAVWFVVLGYCLVLSRLEAGQRGMAAVGSAMEQGWALAVVAHLMTLFVASRVFDVVALCMSFPAVLLGAWYAFFTMRTAHGAFLERQTSVTIPTVLLCSLAILQVLAMALGWTGTQAWATDSAYVQRATLLPFEAMWHLPISVAAGTALSLCVTYGALAGTLALMLERAGVRAPWLASGALAAAVALTLPSAASSTTATGVDLTAPILAGASAVALAKLHRISQAT